jgi:hypothetical protein
VRHVSGGAGVSRAVLAGVAAKLGVLSIARKIARVVVKNPVFSCCFVSSFFCFLFRYVHRNGASITRCSQPKVNRTELFNCFSLIVVCFIGGSSGGDQILLQAILDANPNKEQPVLRLIDARPKLNAIANQAMGKVCFIDCGTVFSL